jgi:hypothetical protein
MTGSAKQSRRLQEGWIASPQKLLAMTREAAIQQGVDTALPAQLCLRTLPPAPQYSCNTNCTAVDHHKFIRKRSIGGHRLASARHIDPSIPAQSVRECLRYDTHSTRRFLRGDAWAGPMTPLSTPRQTSVASWDHGCIFVKELP